VVVSVNGDGVSVFDVKSNGPFPSSVIFSTFDRAARLVGVGPVEHVGRLVDREGRRGVTDRWRHPGAGVQLTSAKASSMGLAA
jgi:hypothetical protein